MLNSSRITLGIIDYVMRGIIGMPMVTSPLHHQFVFTCISLHPEPCGEIRKQIYILVCRSYLSLSLLFSNRPASRQSCAYAITMLGPAAGPVLSCDRTWLRNTAEPCLSVHRTAQDPRWRIVRCLELLPDDDILFIMYYD